MQRLHHPGRKLIFIMKAAELEIFITVITSRLREGPLYIYARPNQIVLFDWREMANLQCYCNHYCWL